MSLPSGAIRLNWIQSTGTQYVDTGFVPNQDTRIVMDATVLNVDSTNVGGFFFGSGYPTQQNGFEAYIFNNVFCGVYNGSQVDGNATVSVGQRMAIDFNKNICFVTADGVTVYNNTFTYSTFTSTTNLALFVLPRSTKFYGVLKLYSCQIYDNGLLVRDYIPAKTIEGEVGLYDRVFHEFYRNAGTGEFIAGPEAVKAPKAPANFRVVSESDTEVTLAWNASKNAVGYLVRQSGMVIADTTELTATAEIQPFGYYTFEVSAYNEFGEGERSALAVFCTPDNPMLWLVTDRTVQDVMAQNNKGVYQTADLNRVGAAVDLLKNLLESAGFVVNVSPKLRWKDTEWVDTAQAAQYLADIQELRSKQTVLPTTPETPATLEKLTYTRANQIEQVLLDVYTQYLIMLTTRVAAGTAISGGDYL